MSSDNTINSAAMLVDTTRAISNTNSPALVVPMQQSDPSVLAPGGKWYMVYVPPGGILPMIPLSNVNATTTMSSATVSVEEATSSTEIQSDSISRNDESHVKRLGNGHAGKSRRKWRGRKMTARQNQIMQTPSRVNLGFHNQPTDFASQSNYPFRFSNTTGYQPNRPF